MTKVFGCEPLGITRSSFQTAADYQPFDLQSRCLGVAPVIPAGRNAIPDYSFRSKCLAFPKSPQLPPVALGGPPLVIVHRSRSEVAKFSCSRTVLDTLGGFRVQQLRL